MQSWRLSLTCGDAEIFQYQRTFANSVRIASDYPVLSLLFLAVYGRPAYIERVLFFESIAASLFLCEYFNT